MRLAAVALLCVVLGFTGCSDHQSVPASRPSTAKQTRPSAPRPKAGPPLAANRDAHANLPALMRALVPRSERASLTADELKVNECGISPTFPCMNAFFSVAQGKPLAVRLHRLRALAVSNGWRVERVKREQNATYLELARGDVHARYTLSRLGGPGASIVEVSVAGPLAALPVPSPADRAAWSSEKRQYVQDANRVCVHEFAGLRNPKRFASLLAEASRSLGALPPPPGERQEIETFLRPLRMMARAARAADRADGEDVLPAVVGLGVYATRFSKAASRYGLDKCAVG